LTMDYLYNIIMETRSIHYLERCVERLYKKGFFPLPDKEYTVKYQCFRKISSIKIGRKVLIKLLPKIKQ
ncbi:MAG: glycosyltransferase family 2 protein, partial [Prevotella sp.]|nr:glycosyltransferase family 2 protein [Prevotella sp.]